MTMFDTALPLKQKVHVAVTDTWYTEIRIEIAPHKSWLSSCRPASNRVPVSWQPQNGLTPDLRSYDAIEEKFATFQTRPVFSLSKLWNRPLSHSSCSSLFHKIQRSCKHMRKYIDKRVDTWNMTRSHLLLRDSCETLPNQSYYWPLPWHFSYLPSCVGSDQRRFL